MLDTDHLPAATMELHSSSIQVSIVCADQAHVIRRVLMISVMFRRQPGMTGTLDRENISYPVNGEVHATGQ